MSAQLAILEVQRGINQLTAFTWMQYEKKVDRFRQQDKINGGSMKMRW